MHLESFIPRSPAGLKRKECDMSSHLTTTEVPTDALKFVTQFDPNEFKQLRKDKRFWDLNTLVATIALLVINIGTINTIWFVNVAAAIMLGPVILVALKAAEARRALKPAAEDRALVLRANVLADKWSIHDDQQFAPFVITTEHGIVNQGRPRVFKIEFRDDSKAPMLFHIASTYVGSIVGPHFESVVDYLENAVKVTRTFDRSTAGIMQFTREREPGEKH